MSGESFADRAHGLSVAAIDAGTTIGDRAEAEGVRDVRVGLAERRGPVPAEGTDIAEQQPEAVPGSGQKDRVILITRYSAGKFITIHAI